MGWGFVILNTVYQNAYNAGYNDYVPPSSGGGPVFY